jgi:hypothetical protein
LVSGAYYKVVSPASYLTTAVTSGFCSQTSPTSVSSPSCTKSVKNFMLGNGGLPASGALAGSTTVTQIFDSIVYNPICNNVDHIFTIQTYASGDYLVDEGTVTYLGSSFTVSAATFATSSTTQASNQSTTVQIQLTPQVIIYTGSEIAIVIPAAVVWVAGTSSCTVSGAPTNSPTASCAMNGSNTVTVSGAFTANKAAGEATTVNLINVFNPRPQGTVAFTNTNLVKQNTCTYVNGNFDYVVNSIAPLQAVSITTTSTTYYINIMGSLSFIVFPTSAYVLTNDYIEITLPPQFTMYNSGSLACASISNNISAITCSTTNASSRIIKVATTIHLANFAISRAMVFSVGIFQMPEAATATGAFSVNFVQTAGDVTFENSTDTTITFDGGYIPSVMWECAFSSV